MASKSPLNCSRGKHHFKPKPHCATLLEHQLQKVDNELEGKHSLPMKVLDRSENSDPNMIPDTRQQKPNTRKSGSEGEMQRASREALSNSKTKAERGIMTSPPKPGWKSRKCAASNSDNAVPVPAQPRKAEPCERITKKRQPCFGRATNPGKKTDSRVESEEIDESKVLQSVYRSVEGRENEVCLGGFQSGTTMSELNAKSIQDLKKEKLPDNPVLETENESEGMHTIVQKQEKLATMDLSDCLNHLEKAGETENGLQNGAVDRQEHPCTCDNNLFAVDEATVMKSRIIGCNGLQREVMSNKSKTSASLYDIPEKARETRSPESEGHLSVIAVDPLIFPSIGEPHTSSSSCPRSGERHQKRERAGNYKLNAVLEAFQSMSPSQEGRVKTLIRAFESLMSCPDNRKRSSKSNAWSYFRVQSRTSEESVSFKDGAPIVVEGEDEVGTVEREQRCQSPASKAAADICHDPEFSRIKRRCSREATQPVERERQNLKPPGWSYLTQHTYSKELASVGPEEDELDTVEGNHGYHPLFSKTVADIGHDDGSQVGRQNLLDPECNHVKRKYSGDTTKTLAEDVLTNERRYIEGHSVKTRWSLGTDQSENEPYFLPDQRLEADAETACIEAQRKRLKRNISKPQPFKLHTEERGLVKEQQFAKKLEKQLAEEERLRIPMAQGLPWTTDEPEIVPKPPVKEQTKPIDIHLFTEVRAVERADFDQFVEEKLSYLEQQKLEEERLHQIAEEEEIKRMRKEMVPRAQLMPYFDQPFKPRRSSKPLTIPKEPLFHYYQKKRAKSMILESGW